MLSREVNTCNLAILTYLITIGIESILQKARTALEG